MKIIFKAILTLAAVAPVLASCNKEQKTDDRIAAVSELVEPANAKSIVLEATPSASLYFEWKYVDPNTAGILKYQVLFDKQDGDFSHPVYAITSESNGARNRVDISHKDLNKIAGLAGISASDKGTLKWTVLASKGTKTAISSQANTLTITRLAGFDELPIDVLVTGAAAEGGTDLSKAVRMNSIKPGEFEVFTKLKTGSTFYFTDDKSGAGRKFNVANGLLKENGTSTVKADGVYWIKLDFNTGASIMSLVEKVGLYFCPSNGTLFDLDYVGNGTFQKKNAVVEFKAESWGRDERYKFRMTVKENAGDGAEKEYELNTLNGTDSRPNASSPASYYYIKISDGLSQWDDKWKLMGEFDNVPATYTVYLNADQPYTHSVAK